MSLKATVENPRGSVEKLSPKKGFEGADTVLRAVWGLLRDLPRANPRLKNQGFAAKGLPDENPEGALT